MMRGSTVINANARDRVSGDTECKEFPWEPKLVNDLSEGPEGINENPSLVVLMKILKVNEKSDAKEQAQLLILDIGDEGAYYVSDKGASEDVISEFVSGFKDGKLQR